MEKLFFDREYGINELLDKKMIGAIWNYVNAVSPLSIVIFDSDKSLFYNRGDIPHDSIYDILEKKQLWSDKSQDITADGLIIKIFPIVHEFETIAFFSAASFNLSEDISPLCSLFMTLISDMISKNYSLGMTEGIHKFVVEDSYESLKEKNRLLELSERKYRNLAENLEHEVDKKANEIEKVHAVLIHQDKLASIGQLAAGIAHEINNPIGFINSNLNTLFDYAKDIAETITRYSKLVNTITGIPDLPEYNEDLIIELEDLKKQERELDIFFLIDDIPKLIKESLDGAERIRKIVLDLTNFAHPGEQEIQFLDINANIDSTLNVIRNELNDKIRVIKKYGKLREIKCHAQEFNQAFMNILLNSVQAIEGEGKIEIITRMKKDTAEIIISDTGKGIAEENLSMIFNPFFTTRPVGKGTGLGLNVTYNIIKKHNGSINVRSKEGSGTEFRVCLPVT